MAGQIAPISDLAYIEVTDSDPFILFNEWKDEVDSKSNSNSVLWFNNVFCLATTTIGGKVTNRNVLMKDVDHGFVFTTDKRGRKMKDINENPNVAATFVWQYNKNNVAIIKQVRIEGQIYLLSEEKSRQLYEKELPFCKIRANLCHQGQEIDWKEEKKKHDELLKKYLNGETHLLKPDHYIALRIVPARMEFYSAPENFIGDRVEFTKTESTWKYVHLAA